MKNVKLLSIILAIFLLKSVSGSYIFQVNASTPSYQQVVLSSLGGGNTKAYDINNSDQIVGRSNINSQVHHAFLWQDGTMKDLGTLGGTNSVAWGINDKGQIVGESQISSDSATHAFIWENGHMTDIGIISNDKYSVLGVPQILIDEAIFNNHDITINTAAYDINENGNIVGKGYIDTMYGLDAHNNPLYYMNAYYWKNGNIINLQKDMLDLQAHVYKDSAIESYANAINDSEQIVGSMSFPDHLGDTLYINRKPQEPFLWENGTVKVLGVSATAMTEASDINNSGQITITNFSQSVHPGGGVTYSQEIAISGNGKILGYNADLADPVQDEGYHINGNYLGVYPSNQVLMSFIKGGINNAGNAVFENYFYKYNEPTITLTITPTPTSTLTPTPIEENIRQGGMDLWSYCQSKNRGVSKLVNNTWSCSSDNSAITLDDACTWQYKTLDSKAIQDVLGNPYTWSCYKQTNLSPTPTPELKKLGGMDLYSYCQSHNRATSGLINNIWECMGDHNPIDLVNACVWQYKDPNAQSKQDVIGNPYTWSCYTHNNAVTPTPTLSQIRLGGMDLHSYCKSTDKNLLLTNNMWKCSPDEEPIDMPKACQWQYKNDKVKASQDSTGNPYSWSCYST